MARRPVFVSYSQPDRETAYAIVERLEAAELSCWVAPRDIRPSADWASEIIEAIAAARVMVLVFSAHANASPQVRREVERAVHREVSVLPFRVENVLPSRSLEYFLSSQHWLDAFPPPLEPHYAHLAAYLRQMLAEKHDPPIAAAQAAQRAPFDAAALAAVEKQLAQYIGPVARHLVSRAAARSASLEMLLLQLSQEIDGEAERRRFVELCRQSLRAP